MDRDNKRSQNKLANRAAILEAARACFLELGYDAVTVRDIVRASALAPGTFYNYFPDKETLFREILKQRIDALTTRMHALRAEAPSLEAFLHGSFRALFTQISDDPSFFRLILRNEHAVRSLFSDTLIGLPMRSLLEDLRGAMARGLLPDTLDIELLAAAFYGIAFEMGRVLVDRERPDGEAAARLATRILTDGLSAVGMGGLMGFLRRTLS